MRSAGFWPDRLLIGYKGNNGPVIMAQDKRKSRNGQHWGRQMTTAEKEKRIFDLGKPWTEIMKGLVAGAREASTAIVGGETAIMGSVVKGFDQYVTGYPLDSINAYALAMTWYAPEMPRPGCVWTRPPFRPQS